MKTIYSILMILTLASSSFADTIDFKSDKSTNVIEIDFEKDDNTFTFIYDAWLKKSAYEKQYSQYIAETLYTVSTYGKQNGYSHFAIVNEKMNNLVGYPINSYQGLVQYGRLVPIMKNREDFNPDIFGGNGEETIIVNGRIEMKVIYLKEPIEGLFLYNIDETVTDTKKAL